MNNRDPVNDNYCYPDSDTLINNYDIRLESELAELERKITAVRDAELEQKPLQPSGYNLQKLCSIHKHIFKNLYEWAGKIRTVDILSARATGAHKRAAAGYNLDFDKTDKEMAITADIAAMNRNIDIPKRSLTENGPSGSYCWNDFVPHRNDR